MYPVKFHNDQKAAMLGNSEQRDRAEVHKKAIADFRDAPIAQYGHSARMKFDVEVVNNTVNLPQWLFSLCITRPCVGDCCQAVAGAVNQRSL